MQPAALIVLCLLPFQSMAEGLYTRNLECDIQVSIRTIEICTAPQDALEWSWTGHAIISPSFRIDIDRVKDVYCSLPITSGDTSTLIDMAVDSANSSKMYKVQINNGVLSLLSMLGTKAIEQFPALDIIADERKRIIIRYLKEHVMLTIAESSTSILSPSHPQYVLRDGCT